MFCPTCKRDVAPKSKVDWEAAISSFSINLVLILIVLAVFSAFFTLGMGPVAIVAIAILYGFRGGVYKYCPICYTALTRPSGWHADPSSLSDRVHEQDKD